MEQSGHDNGSVHQVAASPAWMNENTRPATLVEHVVMLLGDLIWVMLNGDLTVDQIAAQLESLVSNDGEHIVSVKLNGKQRGNCLDVEFCVDSKTAEFTQAVSSLRESCESSEWFAGRRIRFAIYVLDRDATIDSGVERIGKST